MTARREGTPWGRWLSLDALRDRLPSGRVQGRFARGTCPVCESRTGAWITVTEDGRALAGCFSCGDWRGLRAALGIEEEGKGWRTGRFRPRPDGHGDAPDMVADADRLDAVYRVLLNHLSMTADQRRNALGRDRGIPLGIRNRMAPLLGPVPADAAAWRNTHAGIVADLLRVAAPEFLRRVPEIAAREGNSYAVLPTRRHAQYLEPWTDERGRIVALRAYMGRRAPDHKYLVTKGRWGPLAHFAFGVDPSASPHAPWVFTEGWMKAEVLAHHLGAVGVAFPGVTARSSWPRGIEALQRLAPDAPAYVAFDAEVWTTRLDLAVSALDLARAIEDATGRPAGFAVWDTTVGADGKVVPKGIDDAIAAGASVHLVDRAAFAAYLGPTLEAWERADAA